MAVPNIDTLDETSRKEMQACGGQFGSANVGSCTDKVLMRAMTNSMDTLIGMLLESVEALDPNTYVIYMGDNGTWMFGSRREFIDNPSLDADATVMRLRVELRIALAQRRIAHARSLRLIYHVGQSVKGDPYFGPDSQLLEDLGYTRDAVLRSKLRRKKRKRAR